MPIKGLSDRQASFPQIGILRKGGAKTSDTKPGPDLDHFRLTTDDPSVAAAFVEAFGNEPKEIEVQVPYERTEQNFDSWNEEWVGGGLVRRCNGEHVVLHRRNDGSYSHDPIPCHGSNCACKPVGRLSVIIPKLQRLAYVVVLTTSKHDIMQLSAQLTALEMTAGSLRGIPLILRRTNRNISTPGANGKRVRREKSLLSIEAAPEWVQRMLAEQSRHALPGATFAALPAPDLIDDDDDDRTVITSDGEIVTPPDVRTNVYAALAKKLRDTYGMTKEGMQKDGLLWTRTAIADLDEPDYTALIDKLQAVERKLLDAKLNEPIDADITL
jgi:hypothetical protein